MGGDCCGMEQLERSIQRSRPGGDSAGTWEEEAGTCEGDVGDVAKGRDVGDIAEGGDACSSRS
jgi:hypothetical protein